MNHAHSYLTKTEIAKQLGYFPAFLIPAVNSSLIFRSLVQQTLSAYVNNPLPNLFKEKLFVCLSRYFGVTYFTICHSCTLHSLGMSATEILNLETIAIPQSEQDIEADLELLHNQWHDGQDWHHNSQVETSLLRCAALIFLQPSQASNCVNLLKELLGIVYYNYLGILLGYIKMCHQWVINNPDISHQQDRRSQLHLGSLLLSDGRLSGFFQSNLRLELAGVNKTVSKVLVNSQQDQSLSPSSDRYQLKSNLVTSYLEKVSFPVMICGENEQILYLNRHWVEVTGYNTSDISTLQEWKQKAKVKQYQIQKLSEEISQPADFPQKLYQKTMLSGVSPQIGTQTQNFLKEIASSLSNLADELTKIEIEDNLSRAVKSEVSITTNKGEKRFWEYYTTPFSLGDLQEELVISVVQDITETVQQKMNLDEIENRLDLLLEATDTGNWSWNLTTNKIKMCDRASRILGLDDFDSTYESFLRSIHPESRESVDLSLIKAIKSNRGIDLKFPIIDVNSAISLIRLKGKLRYDLTREVIELSGIVMDITQRQAKLLPHIKQDKQLKFQQNSSELAKVINLLPSYIFISDIEDKTIALINLKLAQSLGFSHPDAARDKQISECFSPDHSCQILWQQQQVLTYGEEINVQEEVKLSDGIHHFNTTITPLKDDCGEIYALLHTSNDIPDLAATKQALSQRTLQLEAANKELESFSYSVSHDLQAPLRVINGFSQVLWENYQPHLDDRGKHYIQRIQANSKKMGDLIDALLQLSRVTRTQMKSVEVNLSQIARNIMEELQAENAERQVEFITRDDLIATGDPQLLRIVLSNLLHNSWKYTSKRSQGKIEFNLLADKNSKPTFFVRDNGAGFDLEFADKLFTAFKRLHNQDEFPGMGIGLATVQRIIYRHGGKVWAEGKCDRGATIYFSL